MRANRKFPVNRKGASLTIPGVISLDLAWSEAVESQGTSHMFIRNVKPTTSTAFDRVHRLGQQKNVHIERLVIDDSVENKVLAMQDRKVSATSSHLFPL